ncbi:InlB B-repeat-containing protein [Bifidobacterium platyrrhinorum]|uniref:LPXTG cell wall anchor domain-containing protein n=1 Tax=Bifidobacterium platyrrhinorum TaxID=2661628 RepID=A0A6L9SV70_9BIFI|nr:InlB B-repeat-containing protein [Bifidobacterium platyrrhinorum]NEG55051.1 hypothetical protein [Bifidobacterium platyrrhinorum]
MKKMNKAAIVAAVALLTAGLSAPVAFAEPAAAEGRSDTTITTEGDGATGDQPAAGQQSESAGQDGSATGQQGGSTAEQQPAQGDGDAQQNAQTPQQTPQDNTPSATPDEGTAECPLPVTNTFHRDNMTFTVTTNCPQYEGRQVPAILFSNVITQGNDSYTYAFQKGESSTSWLYRNNNGDYKKLSTNTGAVRYQVIDNAGRKDVQVVNHLTGEGDVKVKTVELFQVTDAGQLRHTITYTNEGSAPLTGTLLQTLDTDLNGDDRTTLYADGQGGAYITSDNFTLTSQKLDGTANLYAGSWTNVEDKQNVSGLGNGTVVRQNLDTAIYYESAPLNVAPNGTYTMAFQESVYKAGEYVPGVVSKKLTFDTQGGSSVPDQYVPTDGVTFKPADPTRNGYTFAGWTVDKEGTTAFEFGKKLTADQTIYAQWKKAPAQPAPATPAKKPAKKAVKKLSNTGSSVAVIAGVAVAGAIAGGLALAVKRRRA